MAFITNVKFLREAFEDALSVAKQQKTILQNISTRLSSTITGVDALEFSANFGRVIPRLQEAAAVPGIIGYAQQQFDDPTYDVALEFTSMISALQAADNWLAANIPANSVYIQDGELAGLSYGTGATAPLKALIDAAEQTIA